MPAQIDDASQPLQRLDIALFVRIPELAQPFAHRIDPPRPLEKAAEVGKIEGRQMTAREEVRQVGSREKDCAGRVLHLSRS